MFNNSESFDKDISTWETGNVENMTAMFNSAESFNKDISSWCVENIEDEPDSFNTDSGFENEDTKQPEWGINC